MDFDDDIPKLKNAKHCPNCGRELPMNVIICTDCGVDLRTGLEAVTTGNAVEEEPAGTPAGQKDYRKPRSVDTQGRLSLGFGVAAALIACFFTYANFVVSYLVILIHETGHMLSGLILGFPSIPAFDFNYGGGVTMIYKDNPIWLLIIGMYVLFAWLFWLNRRSPVGLAIFGLGLVGYVVVAHTGLGEPFISVMGHGFELVVAAIFFYRAFSGSIINDMERPVYAFCGAYLCFYDIRFAFALLTDTAAKAQYRNHLAGHLNDFIKIEFDLNIPLGIIAAAFLFLCLLPPLFGYLLHRYREYW